MKLPGPPPAARFPEMPSGPTGATDVPKTNVLYRKMPPKKKIHHDRAFNRGKATSRAPIISGIR